MTNGKGIVYYTDSGKYYTYIESQDRHKEITEHEYKMYRAMKDNEFKVKIQN